MPPCNAPLTSASTRFRELPVGTMVTSVFTSSPSAGRARRVAVSDESPIVLTPTFLPFRSAAELMLGGTMNWNGYTGAATLSTTRSAPLAAALNVCDPPMSANWVSPARRAAMPLLPSTSCSSGARPFCSKIPASLATQSARELPVIWLNETTSGVGAVPVAGPPAGAAALAAASGGGTALRAAVPAGAGEPPPAAQATRPSRAAAASRRAAQRAFTSSDPVDQADVDLVALLLRQVDRVALRIPDAVLREAVRRALIEPGGVDVGDAVHQVLRIWRQDAEVIEPA